MRGLQASLPGSGERENLLSLQIMAEAGQGPTLPEKSFDETQRRGRKD
jgi:hypothetical protein